MARWDHTEDPGPKPHCSAVGSGLGKLNGLNQDKAVELQGGAASEREKVERGGEEWELLEAKG